MKYLIVAPRFTPTSAGIKAMHKLKDDLEHAGYGARTLIIENGLDPKQKMADEIVIYPDCLCGNPLKADHVVRFLFMFAGHFGQDKDFPAQEYMYYYSPEFVLNGRNPENILTIPAIDDSRFPYRPKRERYGTCYLTIKYEDYFKERLTKNAIPSGAVRIDKKTDLRMLFSKMQKLITYDDSAINVEALLAGMEVDFRFNSHFPKLQTLGGFDYTRPVESYAKIKAEYPAALRRFIAGTQSHFQK